MGRSDGTDVHSGDVDDLPLVAVELRNHIGKHLRTGEEMDLNQWIVIVSVGEYFGPKQVGYLAKSLGAQLATISEWNKIPRGDRPAVLDRISMQAGWPVEALEYPT